MPENLLLLNRCDFLNENFRGYFSHQNATFNKSFDIRDPPSNVIGDKVQSRDEAKGKIEAEVIISCRRPMINLYFNTNFHVFIFKQD